MMVKKKLSLGRINVEGFGAEFEVLTMDNDAIEIHDEDGTTKIELKEFYVVLEYEGLVVYFEPYGTQNKLEIAGSLNGNIESKKNGDYILHIPKKHILIVFKFGAIDIKKEDLSRNKYSYDMNYSVSIQFAEVEDE